MKSACPYTAAHRPDSLRKRSVNQRIMAGVTALGCLLLITGLVLLVRVPNLLEESGALILAMVVAQVGVACLWWPAACRAALTSTITVTERIAALGPAACGALTAGLLINLGVGASCLIGSVALLAIHLAAGIYLFRRPPLLLMWGIGVWVVLVLLFALRFLGEFGPNDAATVLSDTLTLTLWALVLGPLVALPVAWLRVRQAAPKRAPGEALNDRTIAVTAGVAFLLGAVGLFAVAIARALAHREHTPLGPLAMTAAQLAVLSVYWFPWRDAWKSAVPAAATVFGVIFLVVSLAIIGWSGAIMAGWPVPFLEWGPFLIVHAAGNIALAVRPRVYLWWILGVWTVGPLAIGAMFLLQGAHPGGFAPLEVLLTVLVAEGGSDLGGLAPIFFWLISLGSFTGTVAGLGFALLWRRRLRRERRG